MILVSLAAFPLLGLALLVVFPTEPPRVPVTAALAVPAGLLLGALLFAALARGRWDRARIRSPAAAGAALAVAAGGAGEEAIWRGFALARMAPWVGVGVALAATTAAFAATHFPALRRRGVAVNLATGAVFGAVFVATGRLSAAVAAHAVYNVLAFAARAPVAYAVELRGVRKRFGDVEALSGVDLTLEHGEVLALLGPNGAGKTTLVSILLGLRRPDAGEVALLGRDPRDRRARAALGAAPQEMSFPPTARVRELLDFARAHFPGAEATRTLLERFELAGVAERQAGGLSTGLRRRLAVALAFAGAPRVLVLDEPTAGLDVESRVAVWELVRGFAAGGGAVLLTTHSLEEASALASRVVVLAHGRVVAADAAVPDEDSYLRLTRSGG